jgi:hypothetical protein
MFRAKAFRGELEEEVVENACFKKMNAIAKYIQK